MKLLTCIFTLLFPTLCYSTEQIPDELNIIGATFEITAYPLESHPHYKEIIQSVGSEWCSGSARGYKANWAIFDNKLWLGELFKSPCADNTEPLDLNLFFDVNLETGAILANWFSGRITYQIGPTRRLSKDSSEIRGVEYEAVVYNISKGMVESRSIEVVNEIWGK